MRSFRIGVELIEAATDPLSDALTLCLAAERVNRGPARARREILEVRPSKSRPDQGVNQDGEAVQVSVGNLILPRGPR